MSDFNGFADLEANDLDAELEANTRSVDNSEKFTCTMCAGTGHYRGVRVHQEKSHCFACKGKGYFKTSPYQRQKAKQRNAAKKAEKEAAKVKKAELFMEEHTNLFCFMRENQWNNFFNSMLESVQQYGRLTEGQLNAAYNAMDKIQAKQAQKENNRLVVDLTKLNEVFDNASQNGLKKPVLRIEGLVVSKAGESSRNAGFLYVKHEGEYAGKVSPEGKFFKVYGTPEEVEPKLIEFCKDPLEAAIRYGRETGNCACCGRELTDPKSIELGIGPICIENWF